MKRFNSGRFLAVVIAILLIASLAASVFATATTYVYITSSGSKYHSTSTCSNMKNPSCVTLEYAKSKGYTQCSKCWSGAAATPVPPATPTPTPEPTPEPTPTPTPTPEPVEPALTATPTASAVYVNGELIGFDAYNINGNNYFKLRDLAYVLSGTEKQFEVGWDGANNSISLTSGTVYTVIGGEMASKGTGNKAPMATTSKIVLDGKEVSFTAYNIENNNYFKLRDIGEAFDFAVIWDSDNNVIKIDTSVGYAVESELLKYTVTRVVG